MSFLSSDESKRRVFEFWTVGWTKGAIWSALENADEHFSHNL